MRDAMRQLAFDLQPDTATVTAGTAAILRLTVTNRAAVEVGVLLDASPLNTTARPDWTRLKGVPEPKLGDSSVPASERFRFLLPVRTLDTHRRSVDGLPSTPSTNTVVPRVFHVRLRPGGKLTHIFMWWALRIPTPNPITYDDAGHRFVPKTAPVPLPPAEYLVVVDLPLHGISPPESTMTTRLRVEKPDTKGDR